MAVEARRATRREGYVPLAERSAARRAAARQYDDATKDRFSGIFEKYNSEIFRHVLGMVRNPDTARDLTQDAFLSAYTSFGNLGEDAQIRAWLHEIAANKALSHIRRSATKREQAASAVAAGRGVSEEAVFGEDPDSSPEEHALRREHDSEVRQAVHRLPEKHARSIALFYFEGKSTAEIGEALKGSGGAAKANLFRGRQALAQLPSMREKSKF
jgi:RNA polymerase sigma-70 factor (ECF subfamily)